MRSPPAPYTNPQPYFIKIEPHANPRHDRGRNQEIPVPFVVLVHTKSTVAEGVRAFPKALTNAKLGRENSNLWAARNLVDNLRFIDFAPHRGLQRATPHDTSAVVRGGPKKWESETHRVVLQRSRERSRMKAIIHRHERHWVEPALRRRR